MKTSDKGFWHKTKEVGGNLWEDTKNMTEDIWDDTKSMAGHFKNTFRDHDEANEEIYEEVHYTESENDDLEKPQTVKHPKKH